MVRHPPGEGGALSGLPLLIVADLPPDLFAWADALRRQHYPATNNRLGAHVTLFHGLPPSAETAVLALLEDVSRRKPVAGAITGLMDLDPGTAFAVESAELVELRAEMAERLHGLIQQKDRHPFRPHITIQARVKPEVAKALQASLPLPAQQAFRFHGLGLHEWDGETWRRTRGFAFRKG